MLSLDATQLAIVASTYKKVSWLFVVIDSAGPTTYRWSTITKSFDGDDYSFKIIPSSFKGIILNRAKSEIGIQAPNELSFDVSNKDNTLTASDFVNGSVTLYLVISDGTDEEIISTWKLNVKSCDAAYQKLSFVCEDFIQQYLQGDYPNTKLIKDLFRAYDTDDDAEVCVPVLFGEPYIPLRSVFIPSAIGYTASTISAVESVNGARCQLVDLEYGFFDFEVGRNTTISGFDSGENNGAFRALSVVSGEMGFSETAGFIDQAAGDSITVQQGSRYYILGSGELVYDIAEVRSPREWGYKSTWVSGEYDFNQSTHIDGDGGEWKAFQPIIADIDADGTADAPGLWRQGDRFLDIPTKHSQSGTVSKTDPADVIQAVLEDFGILTTDIDVAGSFATASGVYSGWGLEFTGAFWRKQPREKVIAELLNQCHSVLKITDKVELHVLSKTSQKTITKAEVIRPSEVGEGTFKYRTLVNKQRSDSGYVNWQAAGEVQDKFYKIEVPVKDSVDYKSNTVINVPFIQDSQDAQRAGTLCLQRKFLVAGQGSFQAKGLCLAVQPDDIVTINHADYGGSADVLIDSMRINPDVSIDFGFETHSDSLDDWDDLSPDAITIELDDTVEYIAWEAPIAGPGSSEDLGRSGFEVWGRPYLVVGPTTNQGQYTSIQSAVNALPDSRHNGVYVLNGVYAHTEIVYFPDRNITIQGESRGGVILRNEVGRALFELNDLTATFRFVDFTVENYYEGAPYYPVLIRITGTTEADNTSNVDFERITFNVEGTEEWGGYGNTAIYGYKGSGSIGIKDCRTVGISNYAFQLWYYQSAMIANNRIAKTTSGGILCYEVADYVISQNIIEDFMYMGIYNHGDNTQRASIISNIVKSFDDAIDGKVSYGIYDNTIISVISGNIVKIANSRTGAFSNVRGIRCPQGVRKIITQNEVEIIVDGATGGEVSGIILQSPVTDSIITENSIKFDVTNTDDDHVGIYNHGDRNVISGNNIDGVNNDAKDIGIHLIGGGNNNQGSDNITYNVGVSVDDDGADNDVTAKDVDV